MTSVRSNQMTIRKLQTGQVMVSMSCIIDDGNLEQEQIDISVVLNIAENATINEVQQMACDRAAALLKPSA